MALQFSTGVRNAMLDTIESTTGTSAVLKIFSGSAPANCGTADSGTTLVTMTLPSDWMAAASGGTKAYNATWQDTSADATGTAGYFRIYPSSPTTTNATIQGTVTATASVQNTVRSIGATMKQGTFNGSVHAKPYSKSRFRQENMKWPSKG